MKTALVQIGNSRGVRIPKAFLEQCQLHDQVELELRHDYLVIRPAKQPRVAGRMPFAPCVNMGMMPCLMENLCQLPNGTPRSGNGSFPF